jgi:rubredoxin
MLASVRMSAWMPAPPEGSEAAKVSTSGGKSGSRSVGEDIAARTSKKASLPPARMDPVAAGKIRFYSNRIGSMKKYMCLICGHIYDEAFGDPDTGIAPGTKWEDVPPNWTCPDCGARKEDYELVEF